MAVLVFLVLLLAMTEHSSANWCVCKDGIGDSALQKALDYACGAGADCNPIHQNGVCYSPNTVKFHCSYAVNSYFQKKGQGPGTCEFAGAAAISSSDPSVTGCAFPSSASSGTSTTPGSTTPSTTTPSSATPSTTTPTTTTTPSTTGTPSYTSTPTSAGVFGTGLGPTGSGTGINTDISHGGLILQSSSLFSVCLTLIVSSWYVLRD